MNKKFFLGAGALVLVAAGALAGKASAKFATTATLFYKGSTCIPVAQGISSTNDKFVTVAVGTHQALINTAGTAATAGLYATSLCLKPVYLVP